MSAIKNTIKNTATTPVTQPLLGRPEMVKNNTGGYAFQTSDLTAFRRFLILGTNGGSFYEDEAKMTARNLAEVSGFITKFGVVAIDEAVRTVREGLASKIEQSLYVISVGLTSKDKAVRQAAQNAVPVVCKTGTQLFQLLNLNKLNGVGWGRGNKNAVRGILDNRPVDTLALHAIKYRQREGWSWKDVLRLTKPKTTDAARNEVFAFMAGKDVSPNHPTLKQFQIAQAATDKKTVLDAIVAGKLPWEAVPDKFRSDPDVWKALLPNMGLTAVRRQLPTLTRNGLIKPLSETEKFVVAQFKDSAKVKASKDHPVAFLDARLAYASGGRVGLSRGETYTPSAKVVDALSSAFSSSFQNVVPAGKNFYLGLDCSGSMSWAACAGSVVMTPMQGAAAMALITAQTEPYTYVAGFMSGPGRRDIVMDPIKITESSTLANVDAEMNRVGQRMGGTDISLPIVDATEKGLDIDCFVIYTDNEQNAGIHPTKALAAYNAKMGKNAKLAVVAMSATRFTVADPNDPNQIDFVGFSADTPRLISAFANGNL